MKRTLVIFILTFALLSTTSTQEANAIPVGIAKIIQEGIKKVIKAVDLMIQRLQNETIWLQNAQKVLENKLSELKLDEIAQWTEKHRKLYADYYEELWKVKNTLATYQRIRQIIDKQLRIVSEYKRVWNLVNHDKHFTEAELDFMYRVYSGILNESIRNVDNILIVINAFKTQMTDAQRLAIISQAGDRIEQNLVDLLEFNMTTAQLSLNRARSQSEIDRVKKLYGL